MIPHKSNLWQNHLQKEREFKVSAIATRTSLQLSDYLSLTINQLQGCHNVPTDNTSTIDCEEESKREDLFIVSTKDFDLLQQ